MIITTRRYVLVTRRSTRSATRRSTINWPWPLIICSTTIRQSTNLTDATCLRRSFSTNWWWYHTPSRSSWSMMSWTMTIRWAENTTVALSRVYSGSTRTVWRFLCSTSVNDARRFSLITGYVLRSTIAAFSATPSLWVNERLVVLMRVWKKTEEMPGLFFGVVGFYLTLYPIVTPSFCIGNTRCIALFPCNTFFSSMEPHPSRAKCLALVFADSNRSSAVSPLQFSANTIHINFKIFI